MLVQATSSRSSSHVGVAAGATKELHKGRDSRSRTGLSWRGLENSEGAVKITKILSSNVQKSHNLKNLCCCVWLVSHERDRICDCDYRARSYNTLE